jgi:nucleotide-binding universal stress UspA family protein
MDETMTAARTLILIDPSSPHGEGGLDVLTEDDTAVTLLLALNGRSATALREFAKAENIDVSMAGLIYLDQVVRRLSAGHGVDDIEAVSTSGSNAVQAILDVMEHRIVNRVVVPASLPGLGGGALTTLLRLCPVPVLVAPRTPGDATGMPIAS